MERPSHVLTRAPFKRGVLVPRELPPAVIQEKRGKVGLSGSEVFSSLKEIHGRDLLQAEVVKNVLTYSATWEPFIVNRDPPVSPDSPLQIQNHNTGELALPYPYVIPSIKEGSENQWGKMQFYWDMYLINKALLASGKKEYIDLAIGHIENFQYLFDRLGYIPNGSGLSIINRTQTPFLSGMVMDVYSVTGDKEWLSKKMDLVKKEYEDVWTYTEREGKERGISRPSHRISEDSLLLRNSGNDILAEHYEGAAQSTMDDSNEWARRSYETAPLNLNCAVYKYEKDLAAAAQELGNFEEAQLWEKRAEMRKQEINEKMWDEKRGMYFNLQLNRKTGKWERDTAYKGLTSFMPLWLKMASDEQAKRVVKQLPEFESQHGLFIATKDSRMSRIEGEIRGHVATLFGKRARRYRYVAKDTFKREQWDYPNTWSPMEYFAIEGLLNYHYITDAKRVIESILRTNAAFFQEKGTLPEKLNGLTGYNGENFQYGDQEGYGWTCAATEILVGRLLDIEDGKFGTITS